MAGHTAGHTAVTSPLACAAVALASASRLIAASAPRWARTAADADSVSIGTAICGGGGGGSTALASASCDAAVSESMRMRAVNESYAAAGGVNESSAPASGATAEGSPVPSARSPPSPYMNVTVDQGEGCGASPGGPEPRCALRAETRA